MELVKQSLQLFIVRIPSNNATTAKHYSQLQYKYRPPVKILHLIALIALGFEAVTAKCFVIGVSCDVTRFSSAYTTNASMRYGTFFFRKATGLFEILVIVKRKEFTFMETNLNFCLVHSVFLETNMNFKMNHIDIIPPGRMLRMMA
jgi:hypothetical protein